MSKKKVFLVIVGVLLVTFLILGNCTDSQMHKSKDNQEYLKNVLGGIVLEYEAAKGVFPKTFEEALAHHDGTLGHRGDLYGGPLAYEKIDDRGFRFIAFGSDYYDKDSENYFSRDNALVVEYADGQWKILDGKNLPDPMGKFYASDED